VREAVGPGDTDDVEQRDFKMRLDELEAGSRVAAEDLQETVDASTAQTPDPQGPEPDRGWFASGG
jgi:hypothetical protein